MMFLMFHYFYSIQLIRCVADLTRQCRRQYDNDRYKWEVTLNGKITHMWRRWGTTQNLLLAFIDELWKIWKSEFWKNEKKKKKKKITGDINILHMCTKNYNHMKYSSWDTELGRFFLSFLAIFWPFTPTSPTPLTTQKTKILKKWKKHLEMSSF